MTFVVWGITLEVKSDPDFKNDIFKTISQRLWVVFVGFNVGGEVFRKIFIYFRLFALTGDLSGKCSLFQLH